MLDEQTNESTIALDVFNQEKNYSFFHAISQIQAGTPQEIVDFKKSNSREPDYPYLSGDAIIYMLNKYFAYSWSFQIIRTEIIPGQALKPRDGGEPIQQNAHVQSLGRLTIPGLGVREQWGSASINGSTDLQQSTFKSASTDALKKCASMFGVGLDVSNKYKPAYAGFSFTAHDTFGPEYDEHIIASIMNSREKSANIAKQKAHNAAQERQQSPQQNVASQSSSTQQQPNQQQIQPQQGNLTESWSTAPQPNVNEPINTPEQLQNASQEPVNNQTPNHAPSEQGTTEQQPQPHPAPANLKITNDEYMALKEVMKEAGLVTINDLVPYIQMALNNEFAGYSDLSSENVELVIVEIMKILG